MHSLVVTVQVCLVIISAFILMLSTRQKRSDILKDILFIDFCLLIINAGYLFELISATEAAALTAYRISYLGIAYYSTFFMSFAHRFCKKKPENSFFWAAYIFDTIILVLVWYTRNNTMFISSAQMVDSKLGMSLKINYGTIYYIFLIKCLAEVIYAIVILRRQIKKTKDKWAQDNYRLIIVGICIVIIGILFRVFDIYTKYNFLPLILTLATMFIEFVIIHRKATAMVESAYGAIINNMDNAIIIVNTELEFEEANPKAYDIFTELHHFEIGGDITALDFGYVYNESHVRYEREGCIYEVQKNPIWNNGRIVGYTAIFIDLTEQIKYMHEMEKLKESADLANRAKSRFLANMSHEIRTPINAILGMNEMILRETKNHSVKQYAAESRQAAKSLLGIVNDVLDFSKIESGKMKLVPVEYKPYNMFDEAVNMILDRAEMKNLEIITEISPELPSVLFGDDIRLKQILVNILTNAVKYTNEGNIRLRAYVKGIEKDGRALIRFEVEDTGIGIKKEDIDKLFSAFERIDETRNRSVEGTGLGMNITMNLLALMNSRLEVESEYGKGSIFSFEVRQRIVDETPMGEFDIHNFKLADETVERNRYIVPNARALVVDDNIVNRNVIRNLLKRTKLQLADADSGAKCLELTEKEHFDLIFMDHMMPEMDGIETYLKLRENPDNKCLTTPVIMLTANAIAGAKEKYLGLGFDGFLSKPVVPDELESALWKYLPQEYIEEFTDDGVGDMSEEADETKDLSEILPEIENVNWKYAMMFFQNPDILRETVVDFYKAMDKAETDLINSYEGIKRYGAADTNNEAIQFIEDYRIHVHTIKNTSAMTGNLTLSEFARTLETMAKNNDVEGINALHPYFMKEFAAVRERLKVFEPEKEQKSDERLSKESLLSMLELLKFSMDEFDTDAADNTMEVLNEYSFDDDIADDIEELSNAVMNLDSEMVTELVERIKVKL